MRARLLLVLACAQLGIAGCSGPVGNSLPSGPVNLGLITSLTGIDLSLGIDVRLGAQQAVDEVNASGGVDGHPARLLVEDDGSGAAGEAAAYSKLVGQKVTGLIGPVDLVASEAAIVSSATRHLPLLSPAGVDQVPTRPNVFLAAPSASRSAQRMLAYARASSLPTVAVAHPTGDPFADVGAAAVRDQASRSGIRVVLDQPFDPGTVDFGPLIEKVRSSGAQLLLVFGGGSGPPLLERAWQPSGLGIPILLSPASATTAFLRAVSDSGEGALVVTTESLLAPSMPATSAVRRQVDPMAASFQRRNGYYPTQAAFDGYAAARLLLKGIADAGSTDPGAIDAALQQVSLATAAGSFHYGPRDHLGLPASWLAIATIRGGRLTPRAEP